MFFFLDNVSEPLHEVVVLLLRVITNDRFDMIEHWLKYCKVIGDHLLILETSKCVNDVRLRLLHHLGTVVLEAHTELGDDLCQADVVVASERLVINQRLLELVISPTILLLMMT